MSKETYKIEIEVHKDMDSKQARHKLIEAVYQATVIFYEVIGEHGQLTDGKRLRGNGHHMAQEISEKAGKMWDERLTDK